MKLYHDLGIESLEFGLWFRKLFFRLKKTGSPEYLFNMTPPSNHHCNTWAIEDITTFYCRIDVFR